jgi:hypothetical protein
MSDPSAHSSELRGLLRRLWLHDEIDQTLTAAKLNLKILAPDGSRTTAGCPDNSIQLFDRLL